MTTGTNGKIAMIGSNKKPTTLLYKKTVKTYEEKPFFNKNRKSKRYKMKDFNE